MKLVTVEYTEDVDACSGREDEAARRTIAKGTVRKVDPMSAKSLVNVRKVAKLVGDADEKKEAREAVKAAAEPPADAGKGGS